MADETKRNPEEEQTQQTQTPEQTQSQQSEQETQQETQQQADEGPSLESQIETLQGESEVRTEVPEYGTPEAVEQARANPRYTEMAQAQDAAFKDYGDIIDRAQKEYDARKAEDEEKTRQDKATAFWTGIGQAGASLVNLLGTSGAFGGRKAYARGNYSSMMKFDLTAKEFSDQAKADHEKRQAALDAINKDLDARRAQIAAYRMQAGKDRAGVLGDLVDKRYDRDIYAAAQKAKDDQEKFNNDYKIAQLMLGKAGQEAQTAQARDASARGWAGLQIKAAGKSGKGGSGSGSAAQKIVTATYSRDGKTRYITGNEDTLWKGMAENADALADEIAKEAGFGSFREFESAVKDQKFDKQKWYDAVAKGKKRPPVLTNSKGQEVSAESLRRLTEAKDLFDHYGKAGRSTNDFVKDFQGFANKYWREYPDFGDRMKTYMEQVEYNPVTSTSDEDDEFPGSEEHN